MQITKEFGAIAILDALGASNYGETEINQFLKSRERALSEIREWAEEKHGSVDPSALTTFTFNDTIVIVFRSGELPVTLLQATSFAASVRKFIVDSMHVGLLFRGSASLGSFYVDERTNTVLGDAVVDAAQWYEQSEWIGVHFTPRAYLELQRLLMKNDENKDWAFFEYDVPMKTNLTLRTFAINWPKIFSVKRLRPWDDNIPERVKLLCFLTNHKIPLGAEQKYFNTIAFFDTSLKKIQAAKVTK